MSGIGGELDLGHEFRIGSVRIIWDFVGTMGDRDRDHLSHTLMLIRQKREG